MDPFLFKTINPSNTYTSEHIPLIKDAIKKIDNIIRSDTSVPEIIKERLLQERLLMLQQLAKITGEFYLLF